MCLLPTGSTDSENEGNLRVQRFTSHQPNFCSRHLSKSSNPNSSAPTALGIIIALNFHFFPVLYKGVLGPCQGAIPQLAAASQAASRAGRGAGLEADRAPGCGAPGCCSRRSGTDAPCDAAASRSPAPAACSSAARVPTSPPFSSTGPARARGRWVAMVTTTETAPRRPWSPARGGPWARRGCAQAEGDASGARNHASARAEKGGLLPARPRRPRAMTPRSS